MQPAVPLRILLPMARYFFNVYNDTVTLDEEGVELPDDRAALSLAEREARALAAESVRDVGHLILSHRIEIAKEGGAEVGVVRFGEAVRVEQ